MTATRPTIGATLVYDGDCGFCTRAALWASRRRRPPRVIAWQDADLDRLGLTAAQCHEAVQWVELGRTESGARAIGRLLLAQGRLWSAVGWVPFVWPFSSAAESTYRFIARHRHKMPGGTAACELRPPEERTDAAQADIRTMDELRRGRDDER